MTTNYPSFKKHDNNTKRSIALLGVFTLAAFLIVLRALLPSFFESFVLVPLGTLRGGGGETSSKLEELQAENERLRQKLIAHNLILEENETLRELLELTKKSDLDLTPARVLIASPETPFDILVIEGGKDQGFQKGNLVFSESEALVGHLSSLSGSTSHVVLYSAAGSSLPVLINGEFRSLARGVGGGNILIEVPRSYEIEEEALITSADGGQRIVGEVESVKNAEDKSFTTLRARLLLGRETFTHLFVEK